MSRRLTREKVFTTLFQADITGESPVLVFEREMGEDVSLASREREYAARVTRGVAENLLDLDAYLKPYLKKNWELKRISVTDRVILRLALYELLNMEEIPPAVSINEAVELAKKFSDEKSASFINGLLDKAYRDLIKGE